MKIIYVNYGWRYEYESDLHSNEHYLSSSENKAWKNSGLYGIWTHDLCEYQCSALPRLYKLHKGKNLVTCGTYIVGSSRLLPWVLLYCYYHYKFVQFQNLLEGHLSLDRNQ